MWSLNLNFTELLTHCGNCTHFICTVGFWPELSLVSREASAISVPYLLCLEFGPVADTMAQLLIRCFVLCVPLSLKKKSI